VFKKLLAALATVALTAGLSTVAIASASADDGETAVEYATSETSVKAEEHKAEEHNAEEDKAEENKAEENKAEENKAEEEQAAKDKAAEEQAAKDKAAEEQAAEEQHEPVVDNVIDIALTYMTGCAPDTTNTWRVRNPSRAVVLVDYNNGGVHKAEPGETFFETKRNTKETMIISWGKDGSGVKPGRVVKAASGSDLPNTSPSCAIVAPSASIAVTECVYASDGKAAFREVRITFDNSKSNVPVAFTVPWFSSFDKTLTAGETLTFRAANMWPNGGGYSVVANGQTFSLPIAGCAELVKPADEIVTLASLPTSFDCSAGLVNFTTTTYTTPYVFDALTVTWVKGKTVEGPTAPSKRAITADETVVHCAVIAPSASIAVTGCVYDSDGKVALREVRITFDNRESTVPVAFTVESFSSFSKIVAAGKAFAFLASTVSASGGGYAVLAGGETFDLQIEGCVEPTKPADVVVTSLSLPTNFDCTGQVSFTSTTSTTSFEFNTSRVTWVEGKTVEGPRVPSSRPFTQDETAEHCATAAVESPRASSCSTTDDQSPYTRWIRLVLDPSLVYSITDDQTDAETVPTSNYMQLAVGKYTVRVAAASGYVLSHGAIERWSLTVADSGSCAPNPSPTPTPSPTPAPGAIPTTGGLSTPPQGESTGGDDIVGASAVSKLPTLDLATDGAADNSGVDPAVGGAVDRVLKTQNQMLVNFGYTAIGALTVLLLCALILLARRYRAAGDQ